MITRTRYPAALGYERSLQALECLLERIREGGNLVEIPPPDVPDQGDQDGDQDDADTDDFDGDLGDPIARELMTGGAP